MIDLDKKRLAKSPLIYERDFWNNQNRGVALCLAGAILSGLGVPHAGWLIFVGAMLLL